MNSIELEKTYQMEKEPFLLYLDNIYKYYIKENVYSHKLNHKVSFSSVIHCSCNVNKPHSKKILKFKSRKGFQECKVVYKNNEKKDENGLHKNYVEEIVYNNLYSLIKSKDIENCIINAVFLKKKLTIHINDFLKISFDELSTYPNSQYYYYIEIEGQNSDEILEFCSQNGFGNLDTIDNSKFSNCKKLNLNINNVKDIKQLLSEVQTLDFIPAYYKFCPIKNKMNVEREIKIFSKDILNDEKKILKSLKEHFTVLPDSVLEKTDYYFDTDNNDLLNNNLSYRIRLDNLQGNINFKIPLENHSKIVIRNEHIAKFYACTLNEILKKSCCANNHLFHFFEHNNIDFDNFKEKLSLKSRRNVYFVFSNSQVQQNSLIGILFFDQMCASEVNCSDSKQFSMIEFEFYDSFITNKKITQYQTIENLLKKHGNFIIQSKYEIAVNLLKENNI